VSSTPMRMASWMPLSGTRTAGQVDGLLAALATISSKLGGEPPLDAGDSKRRYVAQVAMLRERRPAKNSQSFSSSTDVGVSGGNGALVTIWGPKHHLVERCLSLPCGELRSLVGGFFVVSRCVAPQHDLTSKFVEPEVEMAQKAPVPRRLSPAATDPLCASVICDIARLTREFRPVGDIAALAGVGLAA
jgi:hypothetical protein